MERVIPDLGLVLAAGGCGSRFGGRGNKLFLRWRGLPLFCHPLRRFLPLLRPEHVVIAAPAALHARFRRALRRAGLPAALRLVDGGATRQESVTRGLAALPAGARLVAIQDAARPATRAELLRACAESARRHGSGVAARAVTDTIKVVDGRGRVTATPDRATLCAAETPQVFRRRLLARGLAAVARRGLAITDDAQAVEAAGAPVYLVLHTDDNPKVTYPADLRRLRQLLPARRPRARTAAPGTRTGPGNDRR